MTFQSVAALVCRLKPRKIHGYYKKILARLVLEILCLLQCIIS